MQPSIGRRRAIQGLGALAAGALAPRLANAQAAGIRVHHFGGPYKALEDFVGGPFSEATKAKIEWGNDTSISALTKIQTAPDQSPFEIAMMVRAVSLRAMKAGLLAPIDGNRLTNLKQTVDGTMATGGAGVAMMLDSYDIMINTDNYNGRITSWADLLKPELKGKLVLPASGISAASHLVVALTRAMGGKEDSEKDVDATFKALAAIKGNVRTFYTDPVQATQLIERGEAGVAPQFAVRIATLARQNPKVIRSSPKEGVPALPNDWVIAKGAKNMDLAHRYVDLCISQATQARSVETLLATPTRRGVPVPDALRPFVLTDTSRIFFIDEEWLADRQRVWLQRWAREVQG